LVNKIFTIQRLRNYFFRHFPCCSCTETVCIAVCSKFWQLPR